MTSRFTRLLTINNLGYAHLGELAKYLVSESGRDSLFLSDLNMETLLALILSGKEDSLPDGGNLVSVKFKVPGQVTICWDFNGEPEEVTFDEIRLVEIIDIAKVRQLVTAREAARQAEKDKYL